MPHTITVLHVPGCAGAAALAVASGIAAARGDVGVDDVVIENDAPAVASGFRRFPRPRAWEPLAGLAGTAAARFPQI